MAQRPDYYEIEHTADVGFELTAPDLKTAFEKSAAAMFDLICDLDSVAEPVCRRVRVRSRDADLENMMVRWLTELLYVLETEGLLLCHFDVRRLDADAIEAGVAGEPLDHERHQLKADIKAATYHDLKVGGGAGGWTVRVIFDT